MDWCRDIDYGNLPQWIALLFGAIVGGFTIWGIITARSAYLQDVRDRKFAQARLVYGQVMEKARSVTAGNNFAVGVFDQKINVVQFTTDGVMPIAPQPGPTESTVFYARANVNARVMVVRVNNNSEELISEVRAMVQSNDMVISGMAAGVMLAPESSAEWLISVPEDGAFDPEEVFITFTDATGKQWERLGAKPVEPYGPPKAEKTKRGAGSAPQLTTFEIRGRERLRHSIGQDDTGLEQ